MHLFDSDPEEYRLTQRECDKRRNLVKDLKRKRETLALKVSKIVEDKSSLFNVNGSSAEEDQRLLGEDGEYGDTRNKTNRQILDKQKGMLQQQDRQLDELRGIVGVIKDDNRVIHEELNTQDHMLDELGRGMDRTQMKMMRVDNKLKRLIASSNQCCLWVVIIIEIIVLILIIIFA